jgi:predicted nucleic acid-binding protein
VFSAYFDTSVFLAIFNREASGPQIKSLLRELKRERVRIYTSIISVQEVSVLSFRKGGVGDDNYMKLGKLARIETITRDIALLAAKIEAQLIDRGPKDQEDNKRRKWDCFHIATAIQIGCGRLYAEDSKLLKRKEQLGLSIDCLLPRPKIQDLFPELPGG